MLPRARHVTAEPLEPRRLLSGAFVVTNTNYTGAGSLADAVNGANAAPGPDVVSFAIPGSGPHRILELTITIAGGTVLDATTQPGYAGKPLIELVTTSSKFSAIYLDEGTLRGVAVGGYSFGAWIYNRSVVEGCYFGLDAGGNSLPNAYGAVVFGADNTIGGLTPAARNVFSGNRYLGLQLNNGSSGNLVQGNYVGTDPAGMLARPNGLGIAGGGQHNTIGGTVAAARNVVGGNTGDGILFPYLSYDSGSTVQPSYNRAVGNWIGVGATGGALANSGAGVRMAGLNDAVGGVLPGEGNLIAFNATGVVVASARIAFPPTGLRNAIRGNSIRDNLGMGIDLDSDGPTANDALDADAGANGLQNFPVIAAASTDGVATAVSGSLDAAPNATFAVDFYASPVAGPSGYGEGKDYLGSVTVTTDGSGHATFAASFGGPGRSGQVLAATATAADGSTSEFSAALTIVTPPRVTAAAFVFMTGPARVAFTFTQDVYGSVNPADVVLRQLSTGAEFAPPATTYDPATRTIGFVLPAGLPGGDYEATLRAAGVANDADGTGLAGGDVTVAFWHLAGDANRDRKVNFADLVAVAQHYDLTAATWADGDIDGDGKVGFTDLVIVAQNYDANLDLPAPAPVVSSSAAAAASFATLTPITSTASAARPKSAAPARTPAAKPVATLKPVPPAKPLPRTRPAAPDKSATSSPPLTPPIFGVARVGTNPQKRLNRDPNNALTISLPKRAVAVHLSPQVRFFEN